MGSSNLARKSRVTKRPWQVKPITKERLLSNIKEEAGPLPTACWIWQKSRNKVSGYGVLTVTENSKTRTVLAHRLSYTITVGDIPEGLLVLHKCDVRLCINPDHLFIGTNSDNRFDCVSKDRHSYGSHSGNAKLDDCKVNEIRKLLTENKLSIKEISNKLQISLEAIYLIYEGKTWKHLGSIMWAKKERLKGEEVGTSKLTESEVSEIKGMLKTGDMPSVIAKKFDVSTDLVRLIKRGIVWKHLHV